MAPPLTPSPVAVRPHPQFQRGAPPGRPSQRAASPTGRRPHAAPAAPAARRLRPAAALTAQFPPFPPRGVSVRHRRPRQLAASHRAASPTGRRPRQRHSRRAAPPGPAATLTCCRFRRRSHRAAPPTGRRPHQLQFPPAPPAATLQLAAHPRTSRQTQHGSPPCAPRHPHRSRRRAPRPDRLRRPRRHPVRAESPRPLPPARPPLPRPPPPPRHGPVPLPPRSHLATRADRLKGPRVMTAETTTRPRARHVRQHVRPRAAPGRRLRQRPPLRGDGRRQHGDARLPAARCRALVLPDPDPERRRSRRDRRPPGRRRLAPGRRRSAPDHHDHLPQPGPKAVVRASGAGVAHGPPLRPPRAPALQRDATASGLAGWTATARPAPPRSPSNCPASGSQRAKAVRLAYAIDRLVRHALRGRRLSERRSLIAHGRDPRAFWH